MIKLAASNGSGLVANIITALRELKGILETQVFHLDYITEKDIEDCGLDPEICRERLRGKGTPYVMESAVDRFYKIRSDHEQGYMTNAIPNAPWVAQILPHIWEADRRNSKKMYTLSITKEEMYWLIMGFHDGVLDPAHGKIVKLSEDWKKKADLDSNLIKRMFDLHHKLFEAEIQEEPHFGSPRTRRPFKTDSK